MMSILVLICILNIFIVGVQSWNPPKPKTHFIDQPVDHFNWQVRSKFKMRYLTHDDYFDVKKQRIFFYTGLKVFFFQLYYFIILLFYFILFYFMFVFFSLFLK